LSDRDAVGTDVLEMSSALEAMGHNVRIFTPATIGRVGRTSKPAALASFVASPDDLVIYHFSIGWAHALETLRALKCRRIVRYHNITPPEFFKDYSAEYMAACAAGRAEIKPLADLRCDLYLGASPFNVEDFLAVGVPAERTGVLAPFNLVDRLVATHADLALLDRFKSGASTWLSVGRLAPNKAHPNLIDAFAAYLRVYDDAARLIVIGKADPRLSRYTDTIHARIAQLGIGASVHFLSEVSDAELKAAYFVADALVSVSEHEGFCVPLAEAMALGTPVVGYGAGAVGWTAGGAGLIWDDFDPHVFAASVARIREDAALRELLRERGFTRMHEEFSSGAQVRKLAAIVEAL
ncbi:MAG: glycosyltransferase family 4 protein, partial [Rhodanobacteraceae bacterium]